MRLLRITSGPHDVYGIPSSISDSNTFDPVDLSTTWFPSITSFPPEFELVEFYHITPPYAILSHTWEDDEVVFQDMQYPGIAKAKKGFAKLSGACQLARSNGFSYIWIDCCCINKESSAELSEALNSMYQYYADSEVCYAYLSDVQGHENPRSHISMFKWCRWFTRGWTLQELIAPSRLVFYDKHWLQIGTRFDLHDVITAITRIPTQVLLGDSSGISIAKKMSWAALRQTTRPEDLAYSLLGIFGVNMPPLYGEGLTNAFMRLQLQIINTSDDRSIFAWAAGRNDPDLDSRGLFARSPSDFRYSRNVGMSNWNFVNKDSSFAMTNSGLRIHLPLRLASPGGDKSRFLALLHCRDERSQRHLAVHLQNISGQRYVRCQADQLVLDPGPLPEPEDVQQVDVKEGSKKFTGLQLDVKWSLPSSWSCTQWYHVWTEELLWGRATVQPREITLYDQDRMLLVFESSDYAFAAVVQVSDSMLLTNVVTEPRLDRSWSKLGPPSSDKLGRPSLFYIVQNVHSSPVPSSYFDEGTQSQVCRIVKPFPQDELVTVTVYKTPHKAKWNLDISLASQYPTIIKDLTSPDLGFMVQIRSRDFRFKKVLPTDFFLERHSARDIYVSIDTNENAFRIVLLECLDIYFPVWVAITLGVQDAKSWWELVFLVTESEATLENILGRGRETRRWEGDKEPEDPFYQPTDPETGTVTSSSILGKIRTGQKDQSTLQPGSHWAIIEVDYNFSGPKPDL
ncbi:hypothetical protein VKT23_003414 [Stygiomarasmius scandens]|uniref:Heterokaryon incompatibility domain-containing protein n=1 Tax=Marasmiellus scandens TaxID=2682957 RepID=A0ABR1K3J2_9AGAR